MKRTRSELKSQAKSALSGNYWKIILVTFLFAFICGGVSGGMGSAAGSAASSSMRSQLNGTYSYSGDAFDRYESFDSFEEFNDFNGFDGFNNFDDDFFSDDTASLPEAFSFSEFLAEGGWIAIIVGLTLILVLMALSILITVLVIDPLTVGFYRFFLVSHSFPANVSELGYAFDHNYKNSVKTLFFRGLKLFLWTLLFIIPGIIKSYEYRMIPYLLADRPDLSCKEVFAASRDLMKGNKGRAFVLDLSFILWHLLNLFTVGLLGIFFLNPYIRLTDAALYRSICEEKAMSIPENHYIEE